MFPNVYNHKKPDYPLIILFLFVIIGFYNFTYSDFFNDNFYISKSIGVSGGRLFCNPCHGIYIRVIPAIGMEGAYFNLYGNRVSHKLFKIEGDIYYFEDVLGNWEWTYKSNILGTKLFEIPTKKPLDYWYSCKYEERIFNHTGICERYKNLA